LVEKSAKLDRLEKQSDLADGGIAQESLLRWVDFS
jgi:hypothetical protein|tara:strand:- start:522 stop:626 length:105 start_codon:yes stop_codon:yes gene_type:complete